MNLYVNGEEKVVSSDIKTVSDLLRFYELEFRAVIVEINEEVIDRKVYDDTKLSDGDRIELVQFVGGG